MSKRPREELCRRLGEAEPKKDVPLLWELCREEAEGRTKAPREAEEWVLRTLRAGEWSRARGSPL